MMIKKIFLILVFLLSFFCAGVLFAFERNSDYKTVLVKLPYGQTELYATFYCFNDFSVGEQLAKELYEVKNLKNVVKAGGFKKLMPIPPGSGITSFNYSIMTYGREFWFFENRDDGWLWGTGRY